MNRYIKAMEIGLANEKEGIRYFDLVEQLEMRLNYNFNFESEMTFFFWFIDNFDFRDSDLVEFKDFVLDASFHLKGKYDKEIKEELYSYYKGSRDFLDKKFFIKGNAAKQYLDYVELQESRIAATQARKHSSFSIIIAIGAVLISSALGIISLLNTPTQAQPPYEVKVIEDKTNTEQSQKEVDSLKNEIYEAQMIIDSYESDFSMTN